MTKEEKMQLPMIIDKVFIEQKINAYTNKRDGWIPESEEYAAYDLVVREYKCVLSQLMPLSTLPDEEEKVFTKCLDCPFIACVGHKECLRDKII